MSKRKPTRPGEFFKRRFIDNPDVLISPMLADIEVHELASFIRGDEPCSNELAGRISKHTGTTEDLWLNMQAKYDAWESENGDKA